MAKLFDNPKQEEKFIRSCLGGFSDSGGSGSGMENFEVDDSFFENWEPDILGDMSKNKENSSQQTNVEEVISRTEDNYEEGPKSLRRHSAQKQTQQKHNWSEEEQQFINKLDKILTELGLSVDNNLSIQFNQLRGRTCCSAVVTMTGKQPMTSKGMGTSRSGALATVAAHLEFLLMQTYFPDRLKPDPGLVAEQEKLRQYCQQKGLKPPEFNMTLTGFLFSCQVTVNGTSAESGSGHKFCDNAKGAACRVWFKVNDSGWSPSTASMPSHSVFNDDSDDGEMMENIMKEYSPVPKSSERKKSQLRFDASIVKCKETSSASREGAKLLARITGTSANQPKPKPVEAKDMNSELDRYLRLTPQKKLLKDVFDSSCCSEIDVTPQMMQKRQNSSPVETISKKFKFNEPASSSVSPRLSKSSPNPKHSSPVKKRDTLRELMSHDDRSESSSPKRKFKFSDQTADLPSPKSTPNGKRTASSTQDIRSFITQTDPSCDEDKATEKEKKSKFSFSKTDKASVPKKETKKTKGKQQEPCDVPQGSKVFQFENDPDIKSNAKKGSKRKEPVPKPVKKRKQAKRRESNAISKMEKYSQLMFSSDEEWQQPTRAVGAKRQRGSKQPKMLKFLKKAASVDELLQRPETVSNGEDSSDEEEAERAKEERVKEMEQDIQRIKEGEEERLRRRKENAKLRNRLEVELTEERLKSMFKMNIDYLKQIKAGKVFSWRHREYEKSVQTRHGLLRNMITDPFTDQQLEWTLAEISKIWMRTKEEQRENNEYVWKVLLAECFIKFYMDLFGLEKSEAEENIQETPLHKRDDFDVDGSSSDSD